MKKSISLVAERMQDMSADDGPLQNQIIFTLIFILLKEVYGLLHICSIKTK